MNNERRHQLQQNELAEQIDKAKHWLEPYVAPALIGIIALSVLYIGYNFFSSRSSSQRSEASLNLMLGMLPRAGGGEDPEAYSRLAADFPSLPTAPIAMLLRADAELQQGIDALYVDRELSKSNLSAAEQSYRSVLEKKPTSLLQSRAQYGLALALECQGKLPEAKEAYEQLLTLNESTEMVRFAQRRIEVLGMGETESFVTWFQAQQPTRIIQPPPGLPSGDALPGVPDILFPPAATETPATSSTPSPSITDALKALGGDAAGTPVPPNPEVQPPATTDEPAPDATPQETPAAEVPPPVTDAPAANPEQTEGEEAPAAGDQTPAIPEVAPPSPPEPAETGGNR